MAVKKLWLNSPENTRLTLARMTREFYKRKGVDQAATGQFKATCHAIRLMLDFWVFERDTNLVPRLEAIEDALREQQGAERR